MNKIKKYDAAIFGGGISGISCAHNCAKFGLKTIIIEKENYLGGDITGALVVPVMKSDVSGLNTDFYNELVKCAKKYNAQITYCDNNHGWFNPILLKIIFDEMLQNIGVDILFEATPCAYKKTNNFIDEVIVNTKTLSLPIVSQYYIDTTGTAALSKLLGCEMWNDSVQKQPASLRFIMSGIELEKFAEFLDMTDNDKNITSTYRVDNYIHLSTAFTWDKNKKWSLTPYFEKAVIDGILKDEDLAYFQVFSIAGMPNSIAFNCPRLQDCDKGNPFKHSDAIISARSSIYRLSKFCKKYFPGFENAYISSIAPQIGERETSRVKCLYDYTIDDIKEQKKFENPVVHSNYPVDIHSNKKDGSVLMKVCDYELPLESLMSKDYDNLYAAGKIAGCDFKSQAALRVQLSCMSMGEGVAKSIAERLK